MIKPPLSTLTNQSSGFCFTLAFGQTTCSKSRSRSCPQWVAWLCKWMKQTSFIVLSTTPVSWSKPPVSREILACQMLLALSKWSSYKLKAKLHRIYCSVETHQKICAKASSWKKSNLKATWKLQRVKQVLSGKEGDSPIRKLWVKSPSLSCNILRWRTQANATISPLYLNLVLT